jgi:DNA-binding HxlR family transcriptional regulator
VRGRRSGGLFGRACWPWRGGRESRQGGPGRNRQTGAAAALGKEQGALDWREVQARLGPVRHRWDLAIMCNLDQGTGRRPADLLAAINAQAGTGRQLSPQVLSGRLRDLEGKGYIRHEDLSAMPLHRVYYLQPPGQRLLGDLSAIVQPGDGGTARSARAHR